MGLKKTSDGRYLVGQGITDANDYKGSQGYRDIVIQLTADGATDSSFEKLNYLRDYAVYHSGQGNPVMPPSVQVWISNDGTTTAVEADDISYTDGVYTICGIKYTDGAWDFSNAGQQGGGGGLPAVTSEDNGDVLSVVDGAWAKTAAPSGLPPYTSADLGKVLTVGEAEAQTVVVVPEQSGTLSEIQYADDDTAYGAILDGVDTSSLVNEQSVEFVGSIGPSSNTMTLYYLADSNMFATELDGTGFPIVFLAEVDGQNKWLYNSYNPGVVGLAYTACATASVTPVEPKWVQGGGTLVISAARVPDTSDIQLSETFDTIEQAMLSGKPVIVAVPQEITDYVNEGAYTVTDVSYIPGPVGSPEYDQYNVNVNIGGYSTLFTATGRNEYPYVNMS